MAPKRNLKKNAARGPEIHAERSGGEEKDDEAEGCWGAGAFPPLSCKAEPREATEEVPEETAAGASPLGEEERVSDLPLEEGALGTSSGSRASCDEHAGRRIMGAAATIGGAAGMLVIGPVSGVALGAAAAYATTREDAAGRVARRAGAAYVHVQDRAVDSGLQAADRAFDETWQQLSKRLQSVDPSSMPAPLRLGLRRLSKGLQQSTTDPGDADAEEALRLREKHPDRVPVICGRSPYSELPEIRKSKFLVPGSMLCGEFKYIVHKQVAEAMGGSLRSAQTIYIFVNGVVPKTSAPMSQLYAQAGNDGFLQVRYAAENTLG
jgi:GABA(A) receptor-associated protein